MKSRAAPLLAHGLDGLTSGRLDRGVGQEPLRHQGRYPGQPMLLEGRHAHGVHPGGADDLAGHDELGILLEHHGARVDLDALAR
ncbi:MAG: hypothetical protein MZU95_08735 [Desulfomicrobium escambiense]|nr:hypothetical protein [Desulfomicrobium escambiense]